MHLSSHPLGWEIDILLIISLNGNNFITGGTGKYDWGGMGRMER
jgi:hypothetical protein